MTYKRSTLAQDFARKRNWNKFKVSGLKSSTITLNFNHALSNNEKSYLRVIIDILDSLLVQWEEQTEELKGGNYDSNRKET